MLSGLSANTAEEASFAAINALSNADLSLVLLDSAEIAIDQSIACDELSVHFAGDVNATGGLLLHVLHPPTGFHACFSVVISSHGNLGTPQNGQSRPSGYLIALPDIQFSNSPISLASCGIPLFPWSVSEYLVPLTLILLEKGQPDATDNSTSVNSKAALLVGGTRIGEIDLQWNDDLDIDSLLGGYSDTMNRTTARRLLCCGSPQNGFVLEDASGANHVISFESALIAANNGTASRASANLIMSVLAVLQGLSGISAMEAREQSNSKA